MHTKESLQYGISLSGGGARGIVHLGVLQALEERNIPISAIAGTSMGAIIGVLYAAGMPPKEILSVVQQHSFSQLFRFRKWKAGLLDLDYLRKILDTHIGRISFEDLPIPFAAAISNLNTGLGEVKNEGPLIDTVIASASIPIIFEPITINNELYVDGGLTNNMPIAFLQKYCQKTIGVNVNHLDQRNGFEGFRDIGLRCFYMAVHQTVIETRLACDFLIEPKDIQPYGIFDFKEASKLFEMGYQETMNLKF